MTPTRQFRSAIQSSEPGGAFRRTGLVTAASKCYFHYIVIEEELHMTQKLTTEEFKEKVFNYDESSEWSFKGDKPAIIDFYADWCGPCKMVSPILEELSEEYKDQVDIYKVDTDSEQELAGAFGIQSIPSILFIPVNDKPQMAAGALPKDQIQKAMSEVLGVN